MKYDRIEEAINRIVRMEQCFDVLQMAAEENLEQIKQDESLRVQLEMLIQYYEGEQWMEDYKLDEKGLLPKNLKRGILSEDGIYNFLAQFWETES